MSSRNKYGIGPQEYIPDKLDANFQKVVNALQGIPPDEKIVILEECIHWAKVEMISAEFRAKKAEKVIKELLNWMLDDNWETVIGRTLQGLPQCVVDAKKFLSK